MNKLKKLLERWKERRVVKKVSKAIKMWYGITTSINSIEDLPEDVTETMFKVLRKEIEDFLKKHLNYSPVDLPDRAKAKIAVVLFEQKDENIIEGYQIFVKYEDGWITRTGKKHQLTKVKKLKINEKVKYFSFSQEWMESTENTIKGHIIGQYINKTINPTRIGILYLA